MTATLVLSGTSSLDTPPSAAKARVWAPIPVSQRLGPARLGIGEVGGAHDRDENLCRTDLAGEPIDDHRDRVASVIDKQPVATEMGLPHRDRQSRCPAAVQLAEARIAIPFGASLDVLDSG